MYFRTHSQRGALWKSITNKRFRIAYHRFRLFRKFDKSVSIVLIDGQLQYVDIEYCFLKSLYTGRSKIKLQNDIYCQQIINYFITLYYQGFWTAVKHRPMVIYIRWKQFINYFLNLFFTCMAKDVNCHVLWSLNQIYILVLFNNIMIVCV